ANSQTMRWNWAMVFNWFGKKPSAQPTQTLEPTPAEANAWTKLKNALSLTSQSITEQLRGVIQASDITEETIDAIEETLLRADVGLTTTVMITDKIRSQKNTLGTHEKLMAFLKAEFRQILRPFDAANQLHYEPGKLNVYLVVGVNGAGKTTFIGKLAHQF